MNSITLQLGPVCVDKRNPVCRRIPHNGNARLHWGDRRAWNDAWYEEVWGRVLEKVGLARKPLDHPKITITLHAIQLQDPDNAYASVKCVVDGLKKARIIEDDTTEHIELEVKQEKVQSRKEEHVEIYIQHS